MFFVSVFFGERPKFFCLLRQSLIFQFSVFTILYFTQRTGIWDTWLHYIHTRIPMISHDIMIDIIGWHILYIYIYININLYNLQISQCRYWFWSLLGPAVKVQAWRYGVIHQAPSWDLRCAVETVACCRGQVEKSFVLFELPHPGSIAEALVMSWFSGRCRS